MAAMSYAAQLIPGVLVCSRRQANGECRMSDVNVSLDYQTPRQVFEAGCHLRVAMNGKRPATGQQPERRCSQNQEMVSWSRLEPMALARPGLRIMTTGNNAVDSLDLASSLS